MIPYDGEDADEPISPPCFPYDGRDSLVVIYTREPDLLGKYLPLESDPTRVGRGPGNEIVLQAESVSRRHARFERRGAVWFVVDEGSTNGTYRCGERIEREAALAAGDHVKIGPTVFKLLCAPNVELKYHEERHRMLVIDGLTQLHNRRYLYEALDGELRDSHRRTPDVALLMLDVRGFEQLTEEHGSLAGDFVLMQIARLLRSQARRGWTVSRWGPKEFAVVLPGASLDAARALADTLERKVREHPFVYEDRRMDVKIDTGCAICTDSIRSADELMARAFEDLIGAEARRGGPPA